MEKRKSVFMKIGGIAASILLIFCVLMLIGCSTDVPAALETQPQPTLTREPTATSGPTLTPAPPPQPVTFEGAGNQIIDIPEELSAAGIFHAVHTGSGEFIVRGIDTFGDPTELFVDTTGPYDGNRLYFQYDPEKYPTRKFYIKTEGDWELTLYPILEEYVPLVKLPGEYSGKGDDVIFLQPPRALLEVSAEGEGRITVWAHHEGTKDVVIDENAPFSGSTALPYMTVILEILAEGPYTLAVTDK